jgi:hypothetical protein
VFYLTTTLPYVNAEPHIGFAFEIVLADIVARYKRMTGAAVFFRRGRTNTARRFFKRHGRKAAMSPSMWIFLPVDFRV